jgi:hypothetical protein
MIIFYKTVLYSTANGAAGGVPEKEAVVEVQGFTFDQGKYFENRKEIVTLPKPSQWGASTFIYRYPLRYNTGVSFSLDLYSQDVVSIIGLAIDLQPDRSPTAETVRNAARHAY